MKNLKSKKIIILISILSIFFFSSILLNSPKNNPSNNISTNTNFNSQTPHDSSAFYKNFTVISDGYNEIWGWNDRWSDFPRVAVDNSGNIHVVWEDCTYGKWGGGSNDFEIMYANYSVTTGEWSNITIISDGYQGKYWNDGRSYSPSIAIDKFSGNIHVVWWDNVEGKWGGGDTDEEIWYVNYTVATGKWSNATVISDGYQGKYWNDGQSRDPSIAVDNSGNLHVIWEDDTSGKWKAGGIDSEIMYVNYSVASSKWSNVTIISDGYQGKYWNDGTSENPSITTDNLGNLYAVWDDNADGKWKYDTGDEEIMIVNYTVATGKWSNVTVISDGYQGTFWNTGDTFKPSIVTDNSGNIFVVWTDDTEGKWYAGYDDGEIMLVNYTVATGKWSNITIISDGYQGKYWNDGTSYRPSIAIDKYSGTLHVVWYDNTYGPWGDTYLYDEIMYVNYSIATGWSNATVISDGYQGVYDDTNDSESPSIAVDNSGNCHVVWTDFRDEIWTDYSDDREIIYTTSSNGTIDDKYEENDNYNSAYNLTLYENEWLHTIDGYANQSDDDWYEIFALCDETIYIDCNFIHEEGDINLELYYNDECNLICSSYLLDDNESIIHKITSTGKHYIKVFGGATGNSGSNYDLKWFSNLIPNSPDIISPLNYAILTNTSQELKVKVSDPDNDSMTVFFYNESNCALIDDVSGVLNGTIASIIWSGLIQGETYGWYVEVYDGLEYSYSSTNYFTIANSCVISGTEPYNFTIRSKTGDFEVNVSISFSVSESRFLSFACVINNPIDVLLDNSILFIDITLNDTSNLNWVKISIKFNSNLYKNVNPWWFNETSDLWEELSFINLARSLIFFTVDHLSTFSLSEGNIEPQIIPPGGDDDSNDGDSNKIDNTMIYIVAIIIIGASIGITSGILYVRKRKTVVRKQKAKKIPDKIASLKKKERLLTIEQSELINQDKAIKSTAASVKLGKMDEMFKKKKVASVPISTPSPEELERERAELTKIESEIDVKTPKFTCVVHRGVITGNVYICPSCQSFYCDRCAKVLKIKGEKCWYCESEIDISISENDKLKFLEKKAIDLAGEIFSEIPVLKEYIETNKLSTDISKLQEYIFSIIPFEDFEKIDLLDLAIEEKKKFITELINLNPEEKKALIEEMLKEK